MTKKFNLYNKIKPISITIILILLMLTYGVIPLTLLEILNINANDLPTTIAVLYAFVFDVLFLFLLLYYYKKDIRLEFSKFFNKKNIVKNIKTSLYYWFIGVSIMIFSNLIISLFTTELAANETAVREMIDKMPLYMAFQVMVYAPISEEIIFRKSISKIFKNKYLYAITSGLIFGGLHVISSVTSLVDLLHIIPYASLGIVFSLLYRKTNNIFSSMIAHSFHNTLALLLYLIAS